MTSAIISRLIILVFGLLYPAYASFKAVKTKSVRDYLKWMMYWIIFALFTACETFSDVFLSWLPFYYEIKIAFVLWLLSPATKGASILYRKFVHPHLSRHEPAIDQYLDDVREKGYSAIVEFGSKGLTVITNTAVQAAIKGQQQLAVQMQRSYSMGDVNGPEESPEDVSETDEYEERDSRQPSVARERGGDATSARPRRAAARTDEVDIGSGASKRTAPIPPTRAAYTVPPYGGALRSTTAQR